MKKKRKKKTENINSIPVILYPVIHFHLKPHPHPLSHSDIAHGFN